MSFLLCPVYSITYFLTLRCNGPDLEGLNNTLEPLTHRGFQATFNRKYPPAAFRLRIDHKKAEIKIYKLFGKIMKAIATIVTIL